MFAMGIKRRNQRKPKSKPKRGLSVPTGPAIPFRPQKWFILPFSRHAQAKAAASVFSLIPYGVVPAYTWITTQLATYMNPFPQTAFTFPSPPLTPFGTNPTPARTLFFRLLRKNQQVRWAFKRLVAAWRLKHMRRANTEDIATMEPPKKPVRIVDWRQRTVYTFEAKTLLRDIRAKLLLNDQLFPTPQLPRNPYTNLPLTLSQTVGATEALRAYGLTDWSLESYRTCRYSLVKYKAQFQHYLKMRALETTFARPSEDDCVDLVYEFIKEQYDYADASMERTDVWLWFMRNQPNYPRIRLWRQWCYAYYKAQIEQPADLNTVILPGIYREVDDLVGGPIYSMIMEYNYRMAK